MRVSFGEKTGIAGIWEFFHRQSGENYRVGGPSGTVRFGPDGKGWWLAHAGNEC